MKKLFLLSAISLLLLSCNKEKPYVYLVKLNQKATEVPVLNEQKNEIGKIVWKRNGTGIYQGNFESKLTGNYFVEISQPANTSSEVRTNLNDEYVQVYSLSENQFSDDVLIDVSLEITVYK